MRAPDLKVLTKIKAHSRQCLRLDLGRAPMSASLSREATWGLSSTASLAPRLAAPWLFSLGLRHEHWWFLLPASLLLPTKPLPSVADAQAPVETLHVPPQSLTFVVSFL